MKYVLRECFRDLIDYAGLFPPSALPLQEALNNYSKYLQGADREYLSHFVLPVSRFPEVTSELQDLFSPEYPLSLSAIPASLVNDMPAITAFCESSVGKVILGAIETKFDLSVDFITELARHSEAHIEMPPECIAFYEIPACEDWDERLGSALAALAATRAETGANLGFKLRCGGVENHMIPDSERVAVAILRAAENEVPIKFTAGLHHPFRHRDEGRDCMLHGFMNLFFAGFLVASGERDCKKVLAVVSETEDRSLSSDGNTLSWLGHELSKEQVAMARKGSVISFGSCSFSEPLADARKLGWL